MPSDESPYAPAWKMLRIFACARAGHGGLRVWWGVLNDLAIRDQAAPIRIAARAGLTEASWLPTSEHEVPAEAAVALLGALSADSLASPSGREAPPEHLQAFAAGIAALGLDARFYTNVDWDGRVGNTNFGWLPATNAKFDAGVIGFNSAVGFFVWVDED